MKVGIFISLAIVVVIAAVLAVTMFKPADSPTRATSPSNLQLLEYPGEMPSLFPTPEQSANANARYDKAVQYFLTNKHVLGHDNPAPDEGKQLMDLLIDAMHAATVSEGLLDQQIPVTVGGQPRHTELVMYLPIIVSKQAEQAVGASNQARALEMMQAQWALGQRMLEYSVRMDNRLFGVQLMSSAGEQMLTLADDMGEQSPIDPNDVLTWAQYVNSTHSVWKNRIEIIMNTKPHVGDLLRIATEDPDRTFRLAATLRLGIAKFNPGHSGNLRAINKTLDRAIASDDPLIAKAAKAAKALTKEEFRRIY